MDIPYNRSNRMQGVLWKRRDVFRNRWRPRWFVLHPDQHILTYYLMNNQEGGEPEQYVPSSSSNNIRSSNVIGSNRRRTFSESSNVSENTVDYDVVPRGTIYLLGSTVEANDTLSRPHEELYVLSIADHENANHVHLAARTSEARTQWINQIQQVCRERISASRSSMPPRHSQGTPNNSTITNHTSTAYTTPPRTNAVRNQNVIRPTLSPSTPLQHQTLLESPSMASQATENSVFIGDGEWRILYTDELFQDVPTDLKHQIEQFIQTHISYVEDINHPDWRLRSESDGVHCSAYRGSNGPAMIRTIRRGVQNHHPVEYLNLVWDLSTAAKYETNVRSQRLIKSFNPHTSLVYRAYEAVWPTSPRDFATAAFWSLLERGTEQAICAVAFSCHQAEQELLSAFRDQVGTSEFVRGTLNVALNFWTLKSDGLYHARIISFLLNGRIPAQVSQTVMEQQSNMPRVMDAYLTKMKEQQNYLLHFGDFKMDYQSIYNALANLTSESDSPATAVNNVYDQPLVASSKSFLHAVSLPLPIEKETLVLLSPLLLYKLLNLLSVRLGAIFFLVSCVWATKWVIRRHLLTVFRVVPHAKRRKYEMVASRKGITSCRFTVDLKGVLRFLANEKEAKSEHNEEEGTSEILISHILVRALAKAMSQLPHLASRQYLMMPSLYAVDVVFHDHKTGKPIWVDRGDEMTVPEIAELFQSAQKDLMQKPFWQTLLGPTCHIFTSPDSDHAQVDLDVYLKGAPISVCVSGVRLEKEDRQPSLSVAITVQSTDIDECRTFAETIQQSIRFPEMLD